MEKQYIYNKIPKIIRIFKKILKKYPNIFKNLNFIKVNKNKIIKMLLINS